MSLSNEQAVVSGDHDTRRPAQRVDEPTRRGGLGERAHPDTRAGVRGAAPFDGVVGTRGRCSLDLLGVDRSHGAVWQWTHDLAEAQADPPTAEPSRVAVDEKQIEVDGEKKWLYAAIDTDSKLLLDIDVYSRRGIDPAAAFLHRLTEKHDVSDTEFLVDCGGYLTALFRNELSGQLNYSERNYIEKWFQTVSMRINRFHSFWWGSQ